MLPRLRVDKSQPVALRHFFLLEHRIGSVGREGSQGVSGARRGLRHDRVGWGKLLKKRRGDECVFYTLRRARLADEASSDTICRTRRAVKGATGSFSVYHKRSPALLPPKLCSRAPFSLKGDHSPKLACPEAFRSTEDHTREHGRRLESRDVAFFEIQDGTLSEFATSCPNSCQQRLEALAFLRDLLVVSTAEWIWSLHGIRQISEADDNSRCG
jgi:hypothetical protein